MVQERLTVRLRRVVSGTGEENDTLSVFCPRLQHSVDLDACAACECCRTITMDPVEDDSFVVCNGASATMPATHHEDPSYPTPPIREVMTTAVLCLDPHVTIEAIISAFLERGISGAPVVDGQGRALGVVSKTDLVRELEFLRATPEQETPMAIRGHRVDLGPGFHQVDPSPRTAADVMLPIAFTLPELAPVSMAAALMAYEGVHRIPVVADDGRVVGILSCLDVVRWLAADGDQGAAGCR